VQAMGDRFPGLLATHHALMRTAIESQGGIEVSTEGDAFFAVFSTPQAAVAAATEVQRALAEASWPDGATVRVRIGLHAGQGVIDDSTYVGLDVNRAARISNAAHGGQVVISDQTRVLVEGSLPDGVGLRDLGSHRLKDLDRPEQIYQLEIEGLPSEFPPLRSLDIRPKNLPTPMTSLVGREDEIAAVRALIAEHRLVTVLGPGGTGKTRLSIAVAENGFEGLSDGAAFVPLDAVREPALVASAIAHVVGVAETSQKSALEVLTDRLAGQKLLLILDNFEQVVEAADTVQTLLDAAPRIRVLVTSRTPLHLYGEQQYRLSPLGVPDVERLPPPDELGQYEAIRLFLDRARMAQPDFSITTSNARAVSEIAFRLDGMPLAIELAAARSNLLSPDAMLKRLEHRLAVPDSSLGGIPERQRSLRATIEWSYEQLAEREHILLRRLSAFAGGFEVSSAEEVCNADGAAGTDILDPIAALVDSSLLREGASPGNPVGGQSSGEPRFGWLETIREFASERLDESGEADAIARRHADHMLELVTHAEPELLGKDQLVWLDRLSTEHDNIRAALRWAAGSGDVLVGLRIGSAIWRFWQLRAHIREGRDWLAALLAKAGEDADPIVLARAHTAAGGLAYWQADTADARLRYERALELDKQLDDPRRIADDVRNLGFVEMQLRNPQRARELFAEALTRWEALGDPFQIAEAESSLGAVSLMVGDLEAAEEVMQRALHVYFDSGTLPRAADTSMALSIVSVRRGDTADAAGHARQAIELLQRVGDTTRFPTVLDAVFSVANAQGKLADSIRFAAAAVHLRAALGGAVPSYFEDPAARLAAAKKQLGEETYRQHWAEGEALDADSAMARALESMSA
jgi:predicted ATPase